uniref:Putative secreted protein n=1 Tax=Panstrongylus lignarius TaxID=156445 RepID=A0A224XXP4_9HEMI
MFSLFISTSSLLSSIMSSLFAKFFPSINLLISSNNSLKDIFPTSSPIICFLVHSLSQNSGEERDLLFTSPLSLTGGSSPFLPDWFFNNLDIHVNSLNTFIIIGYF